MVRYWLRRRQPGWVSGVSVQAVGATVTGLVMVVIAVTKFTHGAWIVVVLIPTLVVAFVTVRRHYDQVARQLSIDGAAGRGAAADRPLGPRAGGRRSPGRAAGDPLCPGALRGRPRRVRRDHARADPAGRGALEPVRGRDAARGAPLPLPVGGGAAPRVPRSPPAAGGGPPRDDHPAGVHSGPLVAAPAPQPDRAPDQGRAALPEAASSSPTCRTTWSSRPHHVRPEREAHPPRARPSRPRTRRTSGWAP